MILSMSQLFEKSSKDQINAALKVALDNANESPFWAEKTLPYADALLSVLIPLRDQNLLFTPENSVAKTLTPALFISWCDLMSAKALAFTIQESNTTNSLTRVSYPKNEADKYEAINLEVLGKYLSHYTINLKSEWDDFPIAHYNLHIGISDVLKKLVR